MTVGSTTWHVQYTGNGSTDDFAVPFLFLANADLLVTVTTSGGSETTKTLLVDYTVSGSGNEAGGNVHFLVAPDSGVTIDIYRVPSLLQSADLEHNDSLPSTTLERMADLLTMSVQHLDALIRRTLRFSFKDDEVDEKRIEDALGKYPYFNSSGALVFVDGAPTQPITHTVFHATLTAAQTLVTVPDSYTPGSHNLSVYQSGVGKLFIGVHYTETDSTHITLVTPASGGEVLEFNLGEVYDVTKASSARIEQSFTGITGNTLTLTGMTYTPGETPSHISQIIYNESVMHPGSWTEVDTTTITLPFELIASDKVTVVLGMITDAIVVPNGAITEAKLADTLNLSSKTVTLPDVSVTAGKLANTLDLSTKTVTLPDTSITNEKLNLSANASQVKTAINASGSAPIFACRAWAVFDGTATGTHAVTEGGNVATITRASTGIYDVAFTTSMPDANYAILATCSVAPTSNSLPTMTYTNVTTSGFRVVVNRSPNGLYSPSNADASSVSLMVMR